MGTTVALKMSKVPNRSIAAAIREIIVLETKILSALVHSNAVQFLEIITTSKLVGFLYE